MKALILLLVTIISTAQASLVGHGEDMFFTNPIDKSQNKLSKLQVDHIKLEIEKQLGESFHLKVLEEDRLNAFATFNDDDEPQVSITRGLLQHKLMSKNVFSLLVCHELGHFYGGFPKQMRGRSQKRSWSTAEGQADYFSILLCAKKLSFDHTKNRYNKICGKDQQCHSLVQTAYDLSSIYAEIKFWPYGLKVDEPDSTIVYQTELGHPNPQCRLDTFIHAIKCMNLSKQQKNSNPFYTCEEEEFVQPSCWMSPSTFQDI